MFFADLNIVDVDAILEPPPFLTNLDIVAAHLALPHPAVLRKRPVFKAIASLPLHTILRILVLIPELNSDLVLRERKELLTQTVVLLSGPLLGQEVYDLLCPTEKRGAVPPDGVFGVRFGDIFRLPIFVSGQNGSALSK